MRWHASIPRRGWIARLGPPALALGLIAGAAVTMPAVIGAGPATVVGDCLPVAPPGAPPVGRAPVALTVEPLLTIRGEQRGRQLAFEARRGAHVAVNLAAESFVAGPSGDRLVYGQHMESIGSEVRALSLETGCDVRLAQPAGAVRSAVLDAAGESLFIHTVDAETRRDGGITRVDLASGTIEQVLEPLEPDETLGPIYATQLAWDTGGHALVVQSCGAEECLTRVLDRADGRVATYAEPHGPLVGMTANELIVFEPGHHRPAELLAIERHSGALRTLADEVYEAELRPAPDGGPAQLLIETPAGWQEVLP